MKSHRQKLNGDTILPKQLSLIQIVLVAFIAADLQVDLMGLCIFMIAKRLSLL